MGVGKQLVKAVFGTGNSTLHAAIEKRDANLAVLIQQHKGLLDSPNGEGDTPLHRAVACLHEKAVELLLAAGAAIAVANREQRSPLHLAAAADSTELCSMLLDKLRSLTETDVQCMLAKPFWRGNAVAQEVRALLGNENNYEQHCEGLVTITNDTTWRLMLTYVLAGRRGEIIIMPGDQFLLYANLA